MSKLKKVLAKDSFLAGRCCSVTKFFTYSCKPHFPRIKSMDVTVNSTSTALKCKIGQASRIISPKTVKWAMISRSDQSSHPEQMAYMQSFCSNRANLLIISLVEIYTSQSIVLGHLPLACRSHKLVFLLKSISFRPLSLTSFILKALKWNL